jgi:translation initiation factor IF-3
LAGGAGAARALHAPAATRFAFNRRGDAYGSAADLAVKPGADPHGRLLNEEVTARTVRLVRPDGTHAVLRRDAALAEARAAKLDLVQVDASSDPPVCRLLDWAELRAEERQREKESRHKAVVRRRSDVVKEVRMSLRTQEHDLRVKAASATRALEEGHRAKCSVLFAVRPGPNGRDGAGDPDARKQAVALLEAIQVAIQKEAGGPDAPPLFKVEQPPVADGTVSMYCRLVPAVKAKAKSGKEPQHEKQVEEPEEAEEEAAASKEVPEPRAGKEPRQPTRKDKAASKDRGHRHRDGAPDV